MHSEQCLSFQCPYAVQTLLMSEANECFRAPLAAVCGRRSERPLSALLLSRVVRARVTD